MVVTLCGCSTPTHSWSGTDRNLLWTAMVTVARSPDYTSEQIHDRWLVIDNFVEADEQHARIEVHRVLARSIQMPRQNEQRDRRTWYFDIRLLPVDPTAPDISSVTFGVSNLQLIPAQSIHEADRYFMQVDELLHAGQ